MGGIASAIGSFTPFLDLLFPLLPFWKDVKITQSKGFIAGSMALASGVLLGLVLMDLFPGAVSDFQTSNWFDPKWGSSLATAIFIVTKNEEDGTENLQHSRSLRTLGIQIAIALGVHNFPEGLATFAVTIANPQIGILFAIALALHKLPEGLIISLPIYLSTGSRLKAFLIAGSIGISAQMLGAIFGYVLFVTYWNYGISAIIFSIVSGVLLYTVLHGMIPLANKYDPKD
ncbi:9722_t:CDS:2, partial [Dentiscutata erythropus]